MVKVCFVLLLEYGHLTICASIGKYLLVRDPKNEVIFITDDEFEPVIKRQCSKFQTLLFKQPEGAQERHKAKMNNKLELWRKPLKESFPSLVKGFISMQELWKGRQHIVRELVESIESLDFLFIENLFNLPFLMNLKVKWGMAISTNPLRIADQVNYPVMNTGTSDTQERNEFLQMFKENAVDFLKSLDEWYTEFGLVRKPSLSYVQGSEYLNVYLFPKPLNYFEPNDMEGKWIQLNSTIVKDEVNKRLQEQGCSIESGAAGKELLTPEFLSKPGKLILFSMGTIVTRTVEVFLEHLALLKNIQHKFIICKGKFGDQFELPENCVGANNIDQIGLLPLVDLFVTHGGNNSFCEAFYFGTPMVVVGVFGDQLDNACRLEDMKLGKRLHIGNLTKENLESAMNSVLNDESIKVRMAEIGQRIRNDKDGLDEVCDLIYKYCEK